MLGQFGSMLPLQVLSFIGWYILIIDKYEQNILLDKAR
jgi:hypothetical protein